MINKDGQWVLIEHRIFSVLELRHVVVVAVVLILMEVGTRVGNGPTLKFWPKLIHTGHTSSSLIKLGSPLNKKYIRHT